MQNEMMAEYFRAADSDDETFDADETRVESPVDIGSPCAPARAALRTARSCSTGTRTGRVVGVCSSSVSSTRWVGLGRLTFR